MNAYGRPRFWPAAAMMILTTAAGGLHSALHAQELINPPNRYDPRLPYSDAHVGIEKHSPYLYRYENDWQRNRAWRDRHEPLRNLPVMPKGQESKAGPGQGATGNSDANDP